MFKYANTKATSVNLESKLTWWSGGVWGLAVDLICFSHIVSTDEAPTEAGPLTTAQREVFELTKSGSAQGGGAVVQPVIGISQRVRTGPKKKDLGTLGMS